MNNSCFQCKKRILGCHTSCIEYKKYKEEIKMIKINKYDEIAFKHDIKPSGSDAFKKYGNF